MWLDKSDKPIEDHPELPAEHREKTIMKRNPGIPMEVMLKSKIVRETPKAKDYDLNEKETRRVKIGEVLRGLLEKLADDKLVVRSNNKDEPEVTILRRSEAARGEDSLKEKAAHGEDSLKEKQLEDKEIGQTLVEKIPEEILRRTTL